MAFELLIDLDPSLITGVASGTTMSSVNLPTPTGGVGTARTGREPTFLISGSDKYLYFSRTNDDDELDLPTVALGSAITVFLVARAHGLAENGHRILNGGDGGTGNWLVGLNRADNYIYFDNTGRVDTNAGPYSEVKKLVTVTTSATSSRAFVNADEFTVPGNTFSYIPPRIGIGSVPYTQFIGCAPDADVYRVLIYTGEMTTDEIAEKRTELARVNLIPSCFYINTTTMPLAVIGSAYSQPVNVLGGASGVVNAQFFGTAPTGFSIANGVGGAGTTVGATISSTTNPTTSQTLTFKVKLTDFTGHVSIQQMTLNIGTADSIPPTVPGSFAISGATSTTINLAWGASTDSGGSGLAGYTIERATRSDFQNATPLNAGPAATTLTDSNLTAGVTYYYRIQAYDAWIPANRSAFLASTPASLTTTAPTFEIPQPALALGSSSQYYGICAEGQNVHIITSGQGRTGTVRYYRSVTQGASFGISDVTLATNAIAYLEDPICMSGNNIAAFYVKNFRTVDIQDFFGGRTVGQLWCRVSTNGGASWNPEQLVSDTDGLVLRMSACWNGNSLHCVWMDYKGVPEASKETVGGIATRSWDLYYNRSTVPPIAAGQWESPAKRLYASTNKVGENRPSIVSLGNAIQVVWFGGLDGKAANTLDTGFLLPVGTEVFHMSNQNNGASADWPAPSARTQLTNVPTRYSGRTELVAIQPNKLLVTFDRGTSNTVGSPADNDIWSIKGNGIVPIWGSPLPVIEVAGVQTHSNTSHRDGLTHLMWGNYATGDVSYRQSANEGDTFAAGTEQLVFDGTNAAPNIVAIIDTSADFVHAVSTEGGQTVYKRRALPRVATDITPPSIPQNLTAMPSGSQIDVAWEASIDTGSDLSAIAGYELQRSLRADFASGNILIPLGPTAVTYPDVDVVVGVTYYYHVLAKDNAVSANRSAYSNIASATIPLPYVDVGSSGVGGTGGLTCLGVVRRVYERLRKPSQQALPYQTVMNTVMEVVARKKLDLALSTQNSLATTSDWFTPSSNDFTLEEEGFSGIILPIRVERRSSDSVYATGENVPIVNYEVLDTSLVGGISFYGSPLRMAFRDTIDYVGQQQYRIVYESDFIADTTLNCVVGLPQFFASMIVLESSWKLITMVEDSSPEFQAFIQLVSGRWESELMDERESWKHFVRLFKGRAQTPIRRFRDNQMGGHRIRYFKD